MRETDARVKRTRRVLHESLGSLIHERPFEDISVQQILERAGVARSTFYTHFEDKEALLATSLAEICDAAAESARRLPAAQRVFGFTGPIFEHIAKRRDSLVAEWSASACSAIHERLRGVVELRVLSDLQALDKLTPRLEQVPHDLRARHIASTFITVLEWWLTSDSSLNARQINELFYELVHDDA